MVDPDPLFTHDLVKDFFISNGGKVNNSSIVNHFKNFLNDPVRKISNRNKFKNIIKDISYIKMGPDAEKIFILKKKYREEQDYLNNTDSVESFKGNSDKEEEEKNEINKKENKKKKNKKEQERDSNAEKNESRELKNIKDNKEKTLNEKMKEEKNEKKEFKENINIKNGSNNKIPDYSKQKVDDEIKKQNNGNNNMDINNKDNDNNNISVTSSFSFNTKFHYVSSLSNMDNLSPKEKVIELKENLQFPSSLCSLSNQINYDKKKKIKNNKSTTETVEFGLISDLECDWLMNSCITNYHIMNKLLQLNPHLAFIKDMITGYNALHWAAKRGNVDVIKLLCGTYALNPNERTQGGYTPLHLAAICKKEEAIEILVKGYKADNKIRDYSGKLAKFYLAPSSSQSIIQLLTPRSIPGSSQNPSYNLDPTILRHPQQYLNVSEKSTDRNNQSPSPLLSKPLNYQNRHSNYTNMPPPSRLPPINKKIIYTNNSNKNINISQNIENISSNSNNSESNDKGAHSDSEANNYVALETMGALNFANKLFGSTPHVNDSLV